MSVNDIAISRNGVRIRLSDERWSHIIEEHCELADPRLEVLEAITSPARIVEGGEGELLAVRELALGKYIGVLYREVSSDGFVITAFVTRRIGRLERRNSFGHSKH